MSATVPRAMYPATPPREPGQRRRSQYLPCATDTSSDRTTSECLTLRTGAPPAAPSAAAAAAAWAWAWAWAGVGGEEEGEEEAARPSLTSRSAVAFARARALAWAGGSMGKGRA